MSQDALFDIQRGDWEVATRMKFDAVIPVRNEDMVTYSDQAIGYWPVKHKNFPGVEFMLHASLRTMDEVTLAEKSTGMTVAYGQNTDDLLEAASERMAGVTPEKMAKVIENGMRIRLGKVKPREGDQ